MTSFSMRSSPRLNRDSRLAVAIAAVLYGSTALHVSPVHAAADAGNSLEEIIVSARKRDESLQNVPISVQALSAESLSELNVTNFEQYAALLPSVSFKSYGVPGSATILMRGISDGGDGNSSGSQPSVGMYLDEAPVTTISSNLDVHIYDIARIEALAGPQGTLFGASAESGVVRVVTNKPNIDKFEGRVDVSGGSTNGGADSYTVEGFVNIPLGTQAAIRLVGWTADDGGWINNVPGTRNYKLTNGRTSTLSNSALVGNNTNDSRKDGYRAALKVDLNESWTGTVGVLGQNTDSRGIWEVDPKNTGSNNSIQRFAPESRQDDFIQTSWTIEGKIGDAQLTYAGSHLDRTVNYTSDYSKYGEDNSYVPYYACDYSSTAKSVNTDCTSLSEYVVYHNRYHRTSHELRLQSSSSGPLNYVVGLFDQVATHRYVNLYIQPGMSPDLSVPGYGVSDVFFRTDQRREDTQKAIFGELYYDITGSLRATLGARHYDETSAVNGVVGWGPGNLCITDPTCRDTNSNSSVHFTGQIYKANLSWKLSADRLLYVTYSEGYRPGGENRDPGLVAKVGTQAWVPDKLRNYEFGWKTSWLDNRLRWNGATYLMNWDKIQYTEYDFSLSACCGNVYNLASARVTGIESDLTWAIVRGLTFTPSLSYNDAKTTADFKIPSLTLLSVPSGTSLPNVPRLKGNVRIRYEFPLDGFNAYVQAVGTHNGPSNSQIRPSKSYPQDGYNILNLAAGLAKEHWGGELYINNATNQFAELFVHPRPYEYSVVTNRPFSYGLRLWHSF